MWRTEDKVEVFKLLALQPEWGHQQTIKPIEVLQFPFDKPSVTLLDEAAGGHQVGFQV